MEIEKKRETSWNIHLKGNKNSIELTSVEISGEVRKIKFSLKSDHDSIQIQMNKDEFLNFISLLYAFKEVVISEDLSQGYQNNFYFKENILEESMDNNSMNKGFNLNDNKKEFLDKNSIDKEDSTEELNPEEWDPW
ncbi:MAG: hypothetical protein ACP6IY_06800 [Promethearchaeia archaeon]